MFDSVQPHRQQPTRLPCLWDSPGKNAGVGCHFLLQCMKVKSESEVTQLCPTLRNPTDCSPPGSSAHGIFQARVLEWGAIAFSKSLTTVSQSMGETPELRKAANRPGRASGNNIISCEKAGLFLSSFLSLDSFKEIVFVQC